MSFRNVLMDIAAIVPWEEKTLEQLTLKTQEEVGELAQAVLQEQDPGRRGRGGG
jgi:NTP pyrophosphatase (non-canonical NTP hydrolase)